MNEPFRFLNDSMNTNSLHLTGALVKKEAAIAVSFSFSNCNNQYEQSFDFKE